MTYHKAKICKIYIDGTLTKVTMYLDKQNKVLGIETLEEGRRK